MLGFPSTWDPLKAWDLECLTQVGKPATTGVNRLSDLAPGFFCHILQSAKGSTTTLFIRPWELHIWLGDPMSLSIGALRCVVTKYTYVCISVSPSLFSSVQFSCWVMSDSLQPHEPQHPRPPCPSPTPGVYPNSCPLSRWCHPTISSSLVPFSSCPQSFQASGSFQMRQLFTSGGQSIGVSASPSVLPMNTQDWSPLGWTGWSSLQSKGLSRVFSNTIVQKHQFFGTKLSL